MVYRVTVYLKSSLPHTVLIITLSLAGIVCILYRGQSALPVGNCSHPLNTLEVH